MNYKFDVKLTDYSFSLADNGWYKWKLKVKPEVKVDIQHFVKSATLGLLFTRSHGKIKTLTIKLFAGWKHHFGVIFGISISLLNW